MTISRTPTRRGRRPRTPLAAATAAALVSAAIVPGALAAGAAPALAAPTVGGVTRAAADTTQRFDDDVTSPTNGTDYFSYPSGWARGCCFGDLYATDVHYALTGGAPAVFTFTGTRAALSSVKDVDQGEMSVAVDGGAATTVDLYSASRVTQSTVFDTGVLTEGTHTLTITPLGTKNAASSNTIVTIDSVLVTGPVQPQVFGVDLGHDTGAFTGGAAGSLYGQYEAGAPSQNLVDGFGAKTLATKAQDGQQHPGADALQVAPSFFAAGGRDELIYMTDVYRNFPYERTSVEQYQGYLRTEATQAKAVPDAAHIVLIPFNEPDGNWYGGMLGNRDTLHAFEQEWLADVKIIRSVWPSARIAGPNTAGYDEGSFIDFLTFAKANGVLPDVVTWHTLGSPSGVDATVANFRSVVEPAAGVSDLPVDLDEYAAPIDLDNPAAMVPWVSAIERNKVDGDLAYWRVDGSLGDSVAQQNTPNAQWWLFNAYSRMTGDTVAVTPPSGNADGTGQAVATLDPARRQAKVILSGGATTGPARVDVSDIPSSVFGGSVHVTVLADRWSGNTGAAGQWARVSDATLPVVDGAVQVPVDLEALAAYEVVVAPGGGSDTATDDPWRASYEAEDATLSPGIDINTENGDATSGGRDVGNIRTGTDATVGFHVSVPADGDYTLRVFSGSNGHAADVDGPTTLFARVDGGAATPVSLPASYNWAIWNSTDVTLHLTAGDHLLSLGTTGDDGAATQGDVILDRIDLIRQTGAPSLYEAEQAQLSGTTPSYGQVGQSGAGAVPTPAGASETFWVSAATDGYQDLALRLRQRGAVTLTVNGTKVARLTSTKDWSSPTTTAWLQQGVNKVVVTGASGAPLVDVLSVQRDAAADAGAVTVQAESGTTTGIAHVETGLGQAVGGADVTDIGPGPKNALTLSVPATTAGAYVATFRFANAQELPSNHYNPDLMVRSALVSVNGRAPVQVAFGPTYDWNQYFTVGAALKLDAGTNTVKIWAVQQYDWDGRTVGTVHTGDGGVGDQLRTNQAANLDQVTFAPAAR